MKWRMKDTNFWYCWSESPVLSCDINYSTMLTPYLHERVVRACVELVHVSKTRCKQQEKYRVGTGP